MTQHAHKEFSEWACSYDRCWLNPILFEPAHAMLLKELGRLPQGRSLDVGCGTGELAARLSRQGWRAVALDLCEGMLRHAKRKANGNGGIRLAAGDSQHLPFADSSFDVVTCANSFHHYPDQAAVVCEMRRVLRPGGRLFIIDGWTDCALGRVVYDLIVTHLVENKRVWHRNARDMAMILASAGFSQIRQKWRHGFLPLLMTAGVH
jgi:ubiquinone/menaquinone biosynthesis C-methylase UbiE